MKTKYRNGVHDISNEMYHASEGLSRSALWDFKQSPSHYWHKYLNPLAVQQKKTNVHYALGELVHCLVLEPSKVYDRYAIVPQVQELPKVGLLKDVGRETYEHQKKTRELVAALNDNILNEFSSNSQGKELVTKDQFELANNMAASALGTDVAHSLFTDARIESSIYFTHKETGLQCKVRPDSWSSSLVTDLKTVKDGTYRAFQNSAFSYGYFLQAAMIKAALESLDCEMRKFVFYCVEKDAPYACVYYVLDDEALNYGTEQFNNLMEKFARCLDTDIWQSYEPQILCIPNYATYATYEN